MITLYQPKPIWELPSLSPFCVKLETYLKMTKVPYEVKDGDPRVAPKGRIPYVKIDGKKMGDSSMIIAELKKRYGDSLDARLTPQQRAQALAIQSLFEDRLYFASAWLRWSDEASWARVRDDYFAPLMPPVIGSFILKKIRQSFLKELSQQGVGDHTQDEIIAIGKETLTAVSNLLGDHEYFLGSEPSSVDATAYGFIVQQLYVPWESPLKTHARSLPNLAAFCDRMKKRYWS